ncbi:MAG: paraquat-inducible protein A [Cytophagales bacterium]|nr:paraquat-inducible protein A [Cytophagales bacterium]
MQIRIAVLSLLSFILMFSLLTLYYHEKERRAIKEDLIELSNSKYGLFNVDEWKDILTDVLSKKVEEIDFSGDNKEVMKKEIEGFLHEAIDAMEKQYAPKKPKGLLGMLQSSALSAFNVFGQVRDRVPEFADEILKFLERPENRENLQGYIRDVIDKYVEDTFNQVDYSRRDAILAKYDHTEVDAAKAELTIFLEANQEVSAPYKGLLYFLVAAMAFYMLYYKQVSKVEIMIALGTSVFLLVAGVLLPMIDIDARISSFDFIMLGETISFNDQVLYFKSKSILEVVRLMITQGKADIVAVGILVLAFSVLFPLTKVICSFLMLNVKKLQTNAVVKFFVFKSGKWSMADVMVVAIFMSYIGFASILTDQLKQLEGSGTFNMLTTNDSTLNTGFFLFTAFVIMSLVLSQAIQRRVEV